MQLSILSEPEHVPNLPVGFFAVGPAVLFGPEAEPFARPVLGRLPFDEAKLGGADPADLLVLGLSDSGWEPVAATSGSGVLEITLSSFEKGPFVVVLPIPLRAGELLVSSIPANASIYIDRTETGLRTPALLEGVDPGSHEIKLYLPGFNEAFVSIDLDGASGLLSETVLEEVAEPAPIITLDPGLVDGLVVSTSFLDVVADVQFEGMPLAMGVAVLSSNGVETFEAVEFGEIRGAIALSEGENIFQIRANGPNGNTGTTEPIRIIRTAALSRQRRSRSPKVRSGREGFSSNDVGSISLGEGSNQEIQIRLSWNTDTTDLDLHTFDPDGAHSWYGNLGGIPGGMLDRDDVDGFGPEVFTMPEPRPGTYRVAVDSYRIDEIPTRGSLEIMVGGERIFFESYLFTSQDFNATGGQGSSNAAFWNAHMFEIGELEIVEIETNPESPENEAIFTTEPSENRVTVMVEAPEAVEDMDIMLEIEEVNEMFQVDTTGIMGRMPMVDLAHMGLIGLVNPRYSRRLEFDFVAFTLDDMGMKDLESQPRRLRQEVRSQIRQEYVDKRDFLPGFARPTPLRASIIDASQFNRQPGEFFVFREFSAYSDFGPGLAVVNESRVIANAVRSAWGFPLRVTSGWRNPRRNDSLRPDSDVNSYHQTGDAIDLNPFRSSTQRPTNCPCCGAGITTYAQAQAALECTALNVLNLAIYDVEFHANHLHIERDPSGSPTH